MSPRRDLAHRGGLRTFENRVPVVLRPWRYPANHRDCPNAPCESVSSLNLARHVGGFSFSVRRLFGIRAVKPIFPTGDWPCAARPTGRCGRVSRSALRLADGDDRAGRRGLGMPFTGIASQTSQAIASRPWLRSTASNSLLASKVANRDRCRTDVLLRPVRSRQAALLPDRPRRGRRP